MSGVETWQALLDEQGTILHEEAKALWADFKRRRTEAIEIEAGPEEKTFHYSLRVERQRAGVAIRWYRIHYIGQKGKRIPRHYYVERGKDYSYSLAKFKEAHEWERELIKSIEEGARSIRVRSALLAAAAQNLANYFQMEEAAPVAAGAADRSLEVMASLTEGGVDLDHILTR